MRKVVVSFVLAMLFFFVGVFSCSAADVIKLKAANYLPTTHKMSLLTERFCQEIKKRTNGRVEIYLLSGRHAPVAGEDVQRDYDGRRRHRCFPYPVYPGALSDDGGL